MSPRVMLFAALAILLSGCHAGPPVPVGDVADDLPRGSSGRSRELCNGLDDDRDGLTDEDGCPDSYACADAAWCQCAYGWSHCQGACGGPSCRGFCANLQADHANCGACGRACPAGRSCAQGRCVSACAPGRAYCGGACVDVQSDPNRCGSCDRVCPDGFVCRQGTCACPDANAAWCNGECVEPMTDNRHCGACGNACPTGATCRAGACACDAPGTSACGGACVDTTRDDRNCGGCGRACPGGAHCEKGRCECGAGQARCDAGCVDLLTDRRNCGACGRVCPAASTGCVGGACACPGTRGAACEGGCVDLASSRRHCGACGNACGDAHACGDGACLARPVSPEADARLGTRRPTFRWTEGAGVVEVCADRACGRVIDSVSGSAFRGATVARRLEPGVYFWRLRASAAGPAGAARALRIDRRDAANQGLLPPAFDLNGDGFADVAVLSGDGSLAIFLGARGALRGAADVTFARPFVAGDFWIEAVGDAQGDGFGDLVLTGTSVRTAVLGGASTSAIFDTSLGGSDRPLTDLNGDGLTDWFAPETGGLRFGAVTDPISRSTGWAPSGSTARIGTPTRVEGAVHAGDVNGDGRPDFLLGAPHAAPPRVYVGFGSAAGLDRFALLPPAPTTAGYGASLASAGDVNGDGHADLLVGIGAVGGAVYLGGPDMITLHRTLTGPASTDYAVFAAGDVDGDGHGDLLGLPRARGEAWLFRGGAMGLAAEPVVLRDARWAAVESLGVPGDVDGDGFDDVVAGAPSADTVYVFHGAATGFLTRVQVLRGAAGSEFGRAVL